MASRRLRRTPLACALFAGLVLLPGAAAHQDAEHGTLSFFDRPDGTATTTLVCEFWVAGHGMSHDNGTLRAAHHLDGPSAHGHDVGDWNATGGQGGFDFFAGPFTLHETDEYLVDTTVGDEKDGSGGAAHSAGALDLDYTSCEDESEEGVRTPVCPDILRARAEADGNGLLWENVGADHYKVYRTGGDGPFHFVVNETQLVDSDVEQGVTYTYRVAGVFDGVESEDCPVVEITAVPFFGAPAVTVLVLAGTVGAYALLRRRL